MMPVWMGLRETEREADDALYATIARAHVHKVTCMVFLRRVLAVPPQPSTTSLSLSTWSKNSRLGIQIGLQLVMASHQAPPPGAIL